MTQDSRFRRQNTDLYQAAEGYLDKFDRNPSALFVFDDGHGSHHHLVMVFLTFKLSIGMYISC